MARLANLAKDVSRRNKGFYVKYADAEGITLVEAKRRISKGNALTKRALDEFKRQAGILGDTIQHNERLAHNIVNASFHNATFSDRVWMSQDLMKYRLHEILTQALKNMRNISGS